MAQDLDMFLASGKGALSGAGAGAQLGSMAGPQGAVIGAGLGAIVGGVGAGMKQNKANQAQQIPFADPLMTKRLAEIEQTRKNIMTASDPLSQRRLDEAKNVGASIQGAISRNTGGDVQSTIDALLKAQKNTQSAINQGIAETSTRLPYFDNASTILADKIAQRKADLQFMAQQQAMAENAQARKEANLNANAILGTQGGTQTIPESLTALLQLIKNRQQQPATPISQVQPTPEPGMFYTPGDTEIGTNNFMDLMSGLQQAGLFK